jgi:hypothetical protein
MATAVKKTTPAVQPKPVAPKPVAAPTVIQKSTAGTTNIHGNVSRDLNKTDDKTKAWEMQYLDNHKKGISSSNDATANILKAKYGIVDQPAMPNLNMNIDSNNYKTELPSLANVREKWGLQDPNEYAKQMADKNAQIKRDNLQGQQDLLTQNTRESQQALGTDFFSQYRQGLQNQAAGGMNAGIQAGRDNAMQMAQMGQVSGLMRDAGRQEQAIQRDRGRVELERQAEEMEIANSQIQQQIDIAFRQGDFEQVENMRRMQVDLEKEKARIDGERWSYEQEYQQGRDSVADRQWDQRFQFDKGRDERDYNRGVFESDRGYNYQKGRDKVGDNQWQQTFNRGVFESNRGYNRDVFESDRGYNRGVFESNRGYNRDVLVSDREWNQMSPAERERMALDQQYAKARSGWGGGGGGYSSYSSGGGGASTAVMPSQATVPSGDAWDAFMNQYSNMQKKAYPGSSFPNVGSSGYYNKMRGLMG